MQLSLSPGPPAPIPPPSFIFCSRNQQIQAWQDSHPGPATQNEWPWEMKTGETALTAAFIKALTPSHPPKAPLEWTS